VSHYRVLAEFRTLREAVRVAGLEPNRKGERISTEELVKDWKRVAKKLGRRPSRSEYVREGRYSAGAFVARFGAWGKINETSSTTEDTEERRGKEKNSRESTRRSRIRESRERKVERSDKAIAFQWARSLAAIPGPLEGKRRVTEAVAAMVVNTLLPNQIPFTTEDTEKHRGARNGRAERAANGPVASRNGMGQVPLRSSVFSVVKKDRPVMGPPFSQHPLTNAPVNEMGVVFLFALVAWELGFQVESLWGRYPDGRAKTGGGAGEVAGRGVGV
jgi:Homing endonuclease associated repeat